MDALSNEPGGVVNQGNKRNRDMTMEKSNTDWDSYRVAFDEKMRGVKGIGTQYSNTETWTVALWLQNDQGFYNALKEFFQDNKQKKRGRIWYSYAVFVERYGGKIPRQKAERTAWGYSTFGNQTSPSSEGIGDETCDGISGVSWYDPGLNHDELDALLIDLAYDILL